MTAPLFVDDAGQRIEASGHLAKRFRTHALAVGVDRTELHRSTAMKQQIRADDLRATFIMIALANGRSESWVADRTGHRSSLMIKLDRRAVRSVAELCLCELTSLDDANPELTSKGSIEPGGNAGDNQQMARVGRYKVSQKKSNINHFGPVAKR